MSRVLGSSGAGSVRHRGPTWPGRTTHVYSAVPSQDSCVATPCANRLPQSIARQKIHPFQYLMVGAALCLFYLLLSSISEFIGFSWAYLTRGGCIDGVDHVVLPLFSWRRCAHINDRRRAHGRNRPLHRAGNCNVRNAQGGIGTRATRAEPSPECRAAAKLTAAARFCIRPLTRWFISAQGPHCVWLNLQLIRSVLIPTKILSFASNGMAVTLQASAK